MVSLMPHSYRNGSKKYRINKLGKKGDNKVKFKDTKGNWEYNHFQKKDKPNEEEKIKKDLRFIGGFDPRKIRNYLDPPKTKEQLIQDKLDAGIKINSGDKIIIGNYNEKQNQALQKDINSLEKFSVNATVTTDEGRKRKLIKTLEYVLKKGDKNMITLIYLKLKDSQFQLGIKLEKEYSTILKKMNEFIKDEDDLVKLQMTNLHSSQPPLDQKGFTKLDPFQIDVITNIRNKKSTIVSAPTSSGKSVIAGACFIEGKTLVIVPTDVLAWQMSSYIGDILKTNIPIITCSFQSSPKRKELIELVNRSNAVVGTADSILDFLPMMNIKFDWIVFDEIHMIGKEEGSSMEHIAKLYSEVPFLALSATIGNVEELKGWFEKLGDKEVDIVKCDKRFFNLQRYVYFNKDDSFQRVHPLGMIDISELEDGTIMNKSLQPTPPDIWDFAIKLDKVIDLKDLKPYKYFNKDDRITLDMSNMYFSKLLEIMMKSYKGKHIKKINQLIEGYQKLSVRTENVDLLQMILHLKKIKKCPAIIFQENSTSCMRLVREFAKQVEMAELNKYPNLVNDRIKDEKKVKKIMKDNEKNKIDDIPENKRLKMLMQDNAPNLEVPDIVPVQEPHKDFIFNEDQFFTGAIVEGWVSKLKRYFPNTGDDYHWLIIMLWRGVGVYVKGLPDPYLRLVQSLASAKKLAVVFSDSSLVFGVSMPFRTTVILRDVLTDDTLDSMMYHQMAGRAGRRGLDKEGNVVFAGYSWNRIKELSISSFPIVEGMDTMIYSTNVAQIIDNKLELNRNWNQLKTNFLYKRITNEVSLNFYNDISENIDDDGGWDFINNDSTDHNYMVWRLRHDIDCITIPMLIPEFIKLFSSLDPNKEKDQVDAALFLSHFINLNNASNSDYILPNCEYLKDGNCSRLKDYADNLGIDIPSEIDSKVYQTIVMNKLLELSNEKEIDELRNTLFRFSEKIKHLQHYFFHTKQVTVTRLLGKLLTRIWWIYHTSSPLMKSWKTYETEKSNEPIYDSDNSESNYDSSSESSDDTGEYVSGDEEGH